MKWEKRKVADVCELAYGKSLTADLRIPGDYPVYGSAGEVGTHTNYLIEGPGIIIGRKGSVGTVYYEKRNFYPIDTSYYVVSKEENDLRFLYYKFQTLGLNKLNSDAAVPGLNRNVAYEQSSIYPPLPTQRRIASILSAYDDLIENNLKRIKLLEEKAFLRYKGIVRREKIEEKLILDICYITDGTHDSPKQQVDGFYFVTGKHLIGGFIDFSSAYFISEVDHDKIQKRSKVVNGDLILSNIGTIGNVAIIDSPFEFSVKNVIIFKPSNSMFTSFLYCYLNSDEMQTRFQQESSGTSQRFISLAYTRALKIKLPNEEVLKEFHIEVSSLLKLKSILNQQNTKLREARDILLPRLMNGQIV
jgi:type I restriction enzyme S subunit